MPLTAQLRGALSLLILCLSPLLSAAPTVGAEPGAAQAEAEPVPSRPRIGLVLSGGGARGLAHIGVLRALERLRVPVDLIVGTSMGALVGGAYAAGRTVPELEAFVQTANWEAILADRQDRRSLRFSRREEDTLVSSRLDLNLNRSGLSLPPAAAGNSALEQALEQLVTPASAERPTAALPLPFRALATDLVSGELRTLAQEPLFLALRASMAVPGVFAPVRVKGRLLVDGGLVRNLGVDVARQLGADIIIAVNVGSPLLEERDLRSALGVANQMLQILTEQNVGRSLRELRPDDVLIDPQLDDLGFMAFRQRVDAIEVGERAALAVASRLEALALPERDYQQHQARRQGAKDDSQGTHALVLAELRIEGTRRSKPEALRAELARLENLEPGKPGTPGQIERAALALQGRGDFERVDARINDEDGRRHVTLQVQEADWALSRLRLGAEIYSNFDDANRFSLVAMHTLSWLNAWGGELRTVLRLGSQREFSTELNQPLGAGSAWYLAPHFSSTGDGSDVYADGLRAARFALFQRSATLSLGRRLGNWGDVRLGYGNFSVRARPVLPQPPGVSDIRLRGRGVEAQLRVDTLDSISFPSRGQLLTLGLRHLRNQDEADDSSLSVLGLRAYRWHDWAGHIYLEFQRSLRGQAGTLGGFLRLSGTPDDSLDGEQLLMTRLVMARRVGALPLGLGQAVRLGISLEAGMATPRAQVFRASELRLAGSGFLAVDTRFGPVYLALGHTRGGGTAFYLYLGKLGG
ncbi:MAG: patatin-like phospholipase family protein [Roseateles asaccharophilus]|uniref:patatin-like phospholipase family protein n=1 Tax=Roseateles asaccharophilus TaxID=582607 RepID=UPI00391DFE12